MAMGFRCMDVLGKTWVWEFDDFRPLFVFCCGCFSLESLFVGLAGGGKINAHVELTEDTRLTNFHGEHCSILFFDNKCMC